MSQDDTWAKALVWTANSIGLVYNLPQIYHTYQTKMVDDISTLSIILRLICSLLWSFYSVYFRMWDVGISWFITLFSSLMLVYYKIYNQIIKEMKEMTEMKNEMKDVSKNPC